MNTWKQLSDYNTWSYLLKTETFNSHVLKGYEARMMETYGPNVLNQWARFSEKLLAKGLYK